MSKHPQAGQIPQAENLINVAKLCSDYYCLSPDHAIPEQRVSFGTSGHRGSASAVSFNDMHIAAICQALSDYRKQQGITGPIFIGKDTHALSEPALITAIEVLAANENQLFIQQHNEFTPTPVISHAVVTYNRDRSTGLADGIVITPSHNPPCDGGFKYNAVHGGPADSNVTQIIQNRANALIQSSNRGVKRITLQQALSGTYVKQIDFAQNYIASLDQVIDMELIAQSQLRLGTDPLGGSGYAYWDKIAEQFGIDITVVNKELDQRFAFMPLDHDGKIRMDCSSPYAMSKLIALKDKFDIGFGNDPDFDRHGIVCPAHGLMNPNHYLSVAIDYLYQNRPHWSSELSIGKTLVSSSMIDRVANSLGRELLEMPVGFKWFVEGLCNKTVGFAGEESAGGIFLKRNGETWATDKDGFIMSLLAAEITAKTDKTPAEHYHDLGARFSAPLYTRIDVAASLQDKERLASLKESSITQETMAGETINNVQTKAPGNNQSIGGVKISTENGWFAARPSGTEQVYKIYAESFKDETHLQAIIKDAQNLVNQALL